MPTIIALIVFIVILAALSFLRRQAFLDRLRWENGEKTLFEDSGRFESFFRGNNAIKSIYPHAHIVVTNKRIIFTQKVMFLNRFQIAHVINYADKGPVLTGQDIMGGGIFKMNGNGFMTFYTTPDQIRVIEKSGKSEVEITVPISNAGPLLAAPRFVIETMKPEEYVKFLGLR